MFYKTGELHYKANKINGKLEGAYWLFSPKGSIIERGSFHNGSFDGVSQAFDTNGVLINEKYYINGVKVLYSECYESEMGHFVKQEFSRMKNDSIGIYIGQIVKENNVIRNDLSFYALIDADDTVNSQSLCFNLRLMNKGIKDYSCKITFGVPDKNLKIENIDTCFVTTDTILKICNLRLNPGSNHLFGTVDFKSPNDSAIFYIYKDIYIKTFENSNSKIPHDQ